MQSSTSDHHGTLIDVDVIKQHCEFLEEDEMLHLVEAFRKDFQNLVAAPLPGNGINSVLSADEEHYIRGSAGMIGARYIAENVKFLTLQSSQPDSIKKEFIQLSLKCIEQLKKAVQCTYS